MNEWITQLRKGVVEYCVLTIVNKRPSYGYDIVSTLSNWDQLAAKEGTLYPLLKRLQKDNLISSYWVESESGPPRKYYRITDEGQNLIQEMDKEWIKLTNGIEELKGIKGDVKNG